MENVPSGLLQLLFANGLEIVAIILVAFIVELKYFGRKNSMIIFYMITSITAFICFLDTDNFIIWAALSKFAIVCA